jgi:hypothetical protein
MVAGQILQLALSPRKQFRLTHEWKYAFGQLNVRKG